MRNCRLEAVILPLFLVAVSPARAELSTRDLLQACKQVETEGRIDGQKVSVPDKAASGLCIGFFLAVVGVTLFKRADDIPMLGICAPDHLSTYDLVRATEHFVTVNPETMTDRAIVVVLSAAKKAYPCKRNSTGL